MKISALAAVLSDAWVDVHHVIRITFRGFIKLPLI